MQLWYLDNERYYFLIKTSYTFLGGRMDVPKMPRNENNQCGVTAIPVNTTMYKTYSR